jgi:choline dehydrogenase-like flavoprotein
MGGIRAGKVDTPTVCTSHRLVSLHSISHRLSDQMQTTINDATKQLSPRDRCSKLPSSEMRIPFPMSVELQTDPVRRIDTAMIVAATTKVPSLIIGHTRHKYLGGVYAGPQKCSRMHAPDCALQRRYSTSTVAVHLVHCSRSHRPRASPTASASPELQCIDELSRTRQGTHQLRFRGRNVARRAAQGLLRHQQRSGLLASMPAPQVTQRERQEQPT